MTKAKLAAQVWRGARLFGTGFGHSFWVTMLNVPATEKYAILTGVLAATEIGFRQAVPAGKLGGFLADIRAAYGVVKAVQEQKAAKPAA